MKEMVLIGSGAYVGDDFALEIGHIPPCFLPIGNRRLYEHQVESLLDSGYSCNDIYISLPAKFKIKNSDLQRINSYGVNIVTVPEGLSLAKSIVYAWNSTGKKYDHLGLYHGDTLFTDCILPRSECYLVHKNKGSYRRAVVVESADSALLKEEDYADESVPVIAGYFYFESPEALIRSLLENDHDFVSGLSQYAGSKQVPLIELGMWLDFGHLNAYFNGRTRLTTERCFNTLKIVGGHIEKRSATKATKIESEYKWFSSIPDSLKDYTPSLLGKNALTNSYTLEYLPLFPLSDLYVFGQLSLGVWSVISNSIADLIERFRACFPQNLCNESILTIDGSILVQKVEARLNELRADLQQNATNSLNEEDFEKVYSLFEKIRAQMLSIRPTSARDMAVVHGDLCFSNMLYDFRSEKPRVIDPRGVNFNDEDCIYGDCRYDIAKVYHSVWGGYDHLIAGDVSVLDAQEMPSKNVEINKLFIENVIRKAGYDESEIRLVVISLFLSMLPLHNDRVDRQRNFIANCERMINSMVVE